MHAGQSGAEIKPNQIGQRHTEICVVMRSGVDLRHLITLASQAVSERLWLFRAIADKHKWSVAQAGVVFRPIPNVSSEE